jgi:hypothetical protein
LVALMLEPHGDLVDDLARIARASTALAHPRCMAHQVAPPVPGAALAELGAIAARNEAADGQQERCARSV